MPQDRGASHPRVVLNDESTTTPRVFREELTRCSDFTFSVAFVSAEASLS